MRSRRLENHESRLEWPKFGLKTTFFTQIYQSWHFPTHISVFGLFAGIDRSGPGTGTPWFSHVAPLIYFTEFKFHRDITNRTYRLQESKQETIAFLLFLNRGGKADYSLDANQNASSPPELSILPAEPRRQHSGDFCITRTEISFATHAIRK